MPSRLKPNHVFINCPFDSTYRPIFNAIVFTILDLGFFPRCALEEDDGGDYRLEKIERIIGECFYGIPDLSSVALDAKTGLPRFNMPLELGLFLGCRRFGPSAQRRKNCLILDHDRFRYRQFISDISGQDIHEHRGEPEEAIREIRNWMQPCVKPSVLPGGGAIVNRYRRFGADLPKICDDLRLEPDKLTFLDLSQAIQDWRSIQS